MAKQTEAEKQAAADARRTEGRSIIRSLIAYAEKHDWLLLGHDAETDDQPEFWQWVTSAGVEIEVEYEAATGYVRFDNLPEGWVLN